MGDTPASREAIIIIHGMGEQHRNETLRDFVGIGMPAGSLVPQPCEPGNAQLEGGARLRRQGGSGIADDDDVVYANPAPLDDKDLQTYTIRWKDRDDLKTDVYEVYWAPHFRDTKIATVLGWAGKLIMRKRSSVTTARLLGEHPRTAVVFLWSFAALVWWTILCALAAWRADSGPNTSVIMTLLLAMFVLAITDNIRTSGLLGRRLRSPINVLRNLSFAVVGVTATIGLASWDDIPSGWCSFAVTAAVGLGMIAASGYLGLQAMIRSTALFVIQIGVLAVWVALLLDGNPASIIALVTGPVAMFVVLRVAAVIAMSLGDVARYTSTGPNDITDRESIRSQARDLILQLQDLRYQSRPDEFRYRRVSVVGHSLGSVVAYDALHAAWRERHNDIAVPHQLWRGDPEDPLATATAVREHYDMVRANRRRKRWIVTDLVTLACPLAHAEALLAGSSAELETMFVSGELLSSPPRQHPANTRRRISDQSAGIYNPQLRRSEISGEVLFHHRSMFAMVEWNNAYFAHDVVGGPIGSEGRNFGGGVTDHKLGNAKWMWKMLTQFPHTTYWTVSKRKAMRQPTLDSIRMLREILIARPPT